MRQYGFRGGLYNQSRRPEILGLGRNSATRRRALFAPPLRNAAAGDAETKPRKPPDLIRKTGPTPIPPSPDGSMSQVLYGLPGIRSPDSTGTPQAARQLRAPTSPWPGPPGTGADLLLRSRAYRTGEAAD